VNAAEWAGRARNIKTYTVKSVQESSDGNSIQVNTADGTCFYRPKADLGDWEPAVGDVFDMETVNFSRITGIRVGNTWAFRKTNEELAAEDHARDEGFHRSKVVDLERNKEKYAEQEANLPAWLKARIQRFRDAAGEKFLLEGWGYELVVARLAAALAAGDNALADQISSEVGASGNQYSCAQFLARLHTDGDPERDLVPAALMPLTGSKDYS
jgi:hypothetical protein